MLWHLKRILKYLLYAIIGIIALFTGFVIYLIWLQPAFYFPKPSGQYAVGVKTYHWVDTKRKEVLSDDPAHPNRELMVKVWYPSYEHIQDKPSTAYAPYCVQYFRQNQPLIWLLGLSRLMYVYAKPDLPIAIEKTPFPVVLFSPGFRGYQDANTAQCEELASHGYIVVGMTHPYDNSVVQFPDGRIADGLKSIEQRSKGTLLIQNTVIDDSAAIWFADTGFVLNQLEQLEHDKDSFFYQRLDLSRMGMFGHSMGGSTALQMAARDCRIKAAVNLDGSLFGYDIPHTIGKPCMVLLAGNGVIFNERPLTQKEWKALGIHSRQEELKLKATYLPALDSLAQSASSDFYTFVIQGAGHLDLSDASLSKSALPLVRFIASINSSLLRMGSINGEKAVNIVNSYLLAFFDKYLQGRSTELLDGNKVLFAEVERRG